MVKLKLEHLAFLDTQRAGRLATTDRHGQPHVVPVCYACDGLAFFIALDEKPKRVAPERLKRVRNILENDRVALVVDRYDDDWSRLAYIIVQGQAVLIYPGHFEHEQGIRMLRERYPQYRTMAIDQQPVIVIHPKKIVAWGALS